eukprot:Protomagalhaensia_sp_Gyna_25__433@NODE_1203_length_2070_cov_5_824225_g957_i0_p2_GENE_NODE_1203_length_2070_cov_5_824225_g957_i0NODE_1203_length_2070_cov_5_824225_g957_i0_p2_ORF_typecomplete_len176_score27_06TRM13/PF05206_14/2_4e28Methyltransf_32/PF13679_6/4_3e05_NODE_1203_length_2070_cov_5_824225_g957_i0273800
MQKAQDIEAHLVCLKANHQDNSSELRLKLLNSCTVSSIGDRIVFVAKHLCGSASDIALRMLVSCGKASPKQSIQAVLAPCCFHGCSEEGLCGIEFLKGWFNNQLDFRLVQASVGWSTGADGMKQLLGQRLKIMMLIARVLWLRENGYKTRCFLYVHCQLSLENALLLVERKPENQ